MEDYEDYEEEGTSRRPFLIILIVVLVLALVGVTVAFFLMRNKDKTDGSNNLKVTYATEARVFMDEDSLNEAIREAQRNSEGKNIALHYQNDAYSTDGKTFTCRIINSERNMYDMFLIVYADAGWTNELLTTGLVPPGSGFDEITLDKSLESGDHTVYVVYTQVTTDEDGNQAIWNQTAHTMEFHVQ